MSLDTLEKPGTELTVQDRAAIALASKKTRQDLLAMSTKYLAITEIKNSAGRAECHSAAMTLASARIAISKTGKAARDEATKFSKAVIQEEASLIAITEPEEKRLLALRDGWDTVVAAEKAAKEAAERARIAAIVVRIATIKDYVPLAAGCRTAARVDELLTKLSLISLGDFEEFGDEAGTAHLDSMQRVTAIFDEKTQQEAEQARIKAEQAAAAEKLAAERAEFEAAQAAAKVEADRLAAEHAAQMAEAKAKADADLAAQRAAFDAQQAAAKAAADKAAAEQAAISKANLDAALIEADRIATERQRLDDERAAFEAQVEAAKRVAEQAAITQAAIDKARQAQSMPVELLDQLSATVTLLASPDSTQEQATAQVEQAHAAIKKEAQIPDPADADLMWTAICAVAKEYGMTTAQATARLAAIDWTI